MNKNLFVAGLVSALLYLAASANAMAQELNTDIYNVPANGKIDMQIFPRLGEEITGALLTTRVERKSPLQSYFGNTLQCTAPGLWECHVWFNPDGTVIEFYARKKPDGSVELASNEFWYRIAGKRGDYHLCRKPSKNGKETCEKTPWDEGRYLYDEWFINYDRPAEGGLPAYKNVHEHYALIAGHR
jgi:hypothetical protein